MLPPKILFPPHQTQHPRSITHINRRNSIIQRTKRLEYPRPQSRIPTFSARDESRPDKAFEVRVLRGDDGELVDEEVRDGVVVRGEAEPRRGDCEACAGPGQDAACVEIHGCFVGCCEGDAHG